MVSMFVYRCLKSKIVIAVSLSIELPPLASKNSHRRIWKSSIKYLPSKLLKITFKIKYTENI